MLWPIILPCVITFGCLASMVVIVTVAAPVLKSKRGNTFLIATFIAGVTFVPSCMQIMAIVDAHRFGVFEYDSLRDVNDSRVERYLPPTATAITIDKYPQGFRARYSIAEADLIAYLDGLWARDGDRSAIKPGKISSTDVVDRETHKLWFGDLGWPPLDDATPHDGPTADNGAGFQIWYSREKGIAYERAGYW